MIQTQWACLELTNTVGWKARDRPDDRLTSYTALLAWARKRGVLTAAEAMRLRARARSHPAEAARALERVVAVRRLLYGIFSTLASGGAPAVPDLDALNERLAEANRWLRVVPADAGYRWAWAPESGDSLDAVLWRVVRSAADLLTWTELDRLRLCDADDCGWLFIDASRNRSRRWCDMSDCGNRAKVRRHRARRRAASG